MATVEKKRIINLAEKSAPENGDFFAVDSQAGGTKKIPTTALAKASDLTAEVTARTQADNALTSAINSASALIQNPTKTVSGSLVSFTDGADMPMVACTAEIVPKQSGTGTPSPDNVRTISGWESVNVYVTGVNVWDEETELGGLVWANGQPTPATDRLRSKNFSPCVPSTKYHVFNARAGSVSIAVFFYDASQAFINYTSNTDFTTPSNAHYFKLVIQNTTTHNHDISINYPFTDTDYHAYNGTTTSVNLGRTVYGGTLDVVSGVLTDKLNLIDLDNTTKCAISSQTSDVAVFDAPFEVNEWATHSSMPNAISNRFSTSTPSGQAGRIVVSNQHLYFVIAKSELSSLDQSGARAWLNDHPTQFCYELATPETYQLTPTEVKTLLGENNVWADSGDVEITYRRDISIVLENLENAING